MVRFRSLTVLAAAAALLAAVATGPAQAATTAAGVSVAGGDVLTGSGRCQLAFNVSGRGILTGPCGPVGTRWSAGAVPVGRVTWVAPDGLTGLITIDNAAVTQVAGLRVPGGVIASITAAGRVPIGSTVQAVSPVTGIRGGVLTAVNATVNFAGGTVTGLDRTTVCSETGEAGKPVYRGRTALSVAVGGSGNCSAGGVTYGRPVVQLLAQTGRSIY